MAPPAFFDTGSGPSMYESSHGSVYDGRVRHILRAAVLRATCSCGWTGPEQRLDWDTIGEQELEGGGQAQADACEREWDDHTAAVEAATIPLPAAITGLLEQLEAEIATLTQTSPLAAVRAARCTEVTARQAGYYAARGVREDADPERAAQALGLDEASARTELARLGRWNPYHA
ncbi:hypothetical protein ACFYXV_29235 [Streptomyces sp. NPDC002181]|uniref:hypothetical protein n=1 Tax=Streptomyces sp. NPDC002181 TaxID=3364635 RepID=UPI00368E31AD